MKIDEVEGKKTENDEQPIDHQGYAWMWFAYWQGRVFPTPSLAKHGDCTHHDITFHGKGGKTEETKDRHFKNLEPAHIRDGVFPLGKRPVVPEFP